MPSSSVRPLLLIGLLSLAASALLEWLACPDPSGDLLQGFIDGLAVVCLYGYLLTHRPGRLAQSR